MGLDELNADDAMKLADTLMRCDRWSAAVALLEEHADLVEGDYSLSWTLGWAHFKQEHFVEACRFLRRATLLAPQEPVGHWAFGVACHSLGEFDQAEASLLQALRIGDSAMARLELALVYMHQGRSAEAEQVHLDGVRLSPKSAKQWVAYAAFLSDKGRVTEAEEAYAKAHSLPRGS